MRRRIWVGLLLGLAGCNAAPTLSDARGYLHEGDPDRAMFAAREAVRSAPPEQIVAIRRVAFEAALNAGWSAEAAREYLELQALGAADDSLLTSLARGTLRLAVSSDDPARRLHAVAALHCLASDDDVPPLLLKALADPEGSVRSAALRVALAGPDTRRGLEHAGRLIREDPSPLVRADAVEALTGALRSERFDASARARCLELGAASLSDPNPLVRESAVALLSALEAPGARQLLISALGDGNEAVVIGAGCALAADPQIVARWRAAGLPTNGRLGAFGTVLEAHHVPEARLRASRALLSPSYSERLAATRAASAGPHPARFLDVLAELAGTDPAVAIRSAAIAGLVAIDTPATRARLEELIGHEAPETRRRAFLALDRLRPHDTETLARYLTEGNLALLPDVARLLAERGGGTNERALIAALSLPAQRKAALAALTSLTDARLREPYLQLLEHPDPEVRALAGRGLVRCGIGEDRPRLVQALIDVEGAADVPAAAALLGIQRHEAGVRPSNEPE